MMGDQVLYESRGNWEHPARTAGAATSRAESTTEIL